LYTSINNKSVKPKLCTTGNKNIITRKFIKLNIDLSIIPPFVVKDSADSKLAITGFGAYAILRKTLDNMAKLLDIEIKITAPRLDIQFLENHISLEVPDIENHNNIHFVTYAYLDTINYISTNHPDIPFERYNSYLDINYENIKINNIIIYSTEMRIISASSIPINSDKNINIATVQHILLYFLFQYHLTNYTIYLEYYIHLLDIINAAEQLFKTLINKLKTNEDSNEDSNEDLNELINIFGKSIFAPIIKPFGDTNISTTYIIQEGKKIISLDDIDNIPEATKIKNINFVNVIETLPNNIYPNKPLQYINTKNILFSQNGKKIDSKKENFFD